MRFHLGDLRASLPLYAATRAAGERRALRGRIEEDIAHAGEHGRELLGSRHEAALDTVIGLWRAGAFEGSAATGSSRRAEELLAPIVDAMDIAGEQALETAAGAEATADADFSRTRTGVIAVLLAALLLGIGMVLWLVRTVVPRTRSYSRFAARVSEGDVAGRLDPKGADELADLGRTLDVMVERHEAERSYQAAQQDFVDALQLTASEREAHGLLKRHVERTVSDSLVVVLNRNNSDDRLEATTPVAPGSPLADGLDGASPRSCLAVRFARRHEQGSGIDPLVSCEVCGKSAARSAAIRCSSGARSSARCSCSTTPLSSRRTTSACATRSPRPRPSWRTSATSRSPSCARPPTRSPGCRTAAPCRTRSSAWSPRRAGRRRRWPHCCSTSITSSRSTTPTATAAVTSLAAAAEAMRAALRGSDFVGRYGGEEFLILLPDTDGEGAVRAAETVRAAVATVTVPTVEREVTASVGVALLGVDGVDGDGLIRSADRALYAAKSLGRNRVASAGAVPLSAPA